MPKYMADPSSTSSLTSKILENLDQFTPGETKAQALTFQRRFASLPQEIQDEILGHLVSGETLPRTCTRMIPSAVWRHVLLCGKYLPWLWDMDPNIEDHYRDTAPLAYDWELLVRRIVFYARNLHTRRPLSELFRAPEGWWNRIRIMRLVEEMYVNDLLPWAHEPGDPTRLLLASLPRYWTSSGEHAYPVIRLKR
jgi:hypothetical protein